MGNGAVPDDPGFFNFIGQSAQAGTENQGNFRLKIGNAPDKPRGLLNFFR